MKMNKMSLLVVVLILVGGFLMARQGFLGRKANNVTTEITNKVARGGFEFTEEQLRNAKIPFSDLRSGGPAKDGIPSIDDPKFISAQEADRYLEPDDVVLGLSYKGVARAYPHKIMNWHEIVNDTVVGDPLAITYCPLCFTGIGFERKIDGEETTFGVSGRLYNSNLVMFDRTSESLWNQISGEAIIGEHLGKKLKQIGLNTISWGQWKAEHPDTVVLSRDTGYSRDYDRDPYAGYEQNRDTFGTDFEDDRLHPKEKIWGIEIDGKYKAYPDSVIAEKTIFSDTFAGKQLAITRASDGEGVIEDSSGEKIIPTISFWFSWVAFNPDTELFQ
jgi:hypothetical protein